MKSKILAMLAVVAVFGLAIAAYAYTTANDNDKVKVSCCSTSDSCPMKVKGHDHQGGHDSKSHPMEKGAGDTAATESHSCCDCCGDSCPMKKDGEAKVSVVSSEGEKSCCDNCDCCKGKHDIAG